MGREHTGQSPVSHLLSLPGKDYARRPFCNRKCSLVTELEPGIPDSQPVRNKLTLFLHDSACDNAFLFLLSCVCVQVHMWQGMYTSVTGACVHTCVQVHVCTCICVYMPGQVHMYVQIHMFVHMCTCVYRCIYVRVCMETDIRNHPQLLFCLIHRGRVSQGVCRYVSSCQPFCSRNSLFPQSLELQEGCKTRPAYPQVPQIQTLVPRLI